MTLLEKLNLEPGAVASAISMGDIISEVGDHLEFMLYHELCSFAIDRPKNLTNAEFLAACEEWLSKN